MLAFLVPRKLAQSLTISGGCDAASSENVRTDNLLNHSEPRVVLNST